MKKEAKTGKTIRRQLTWMAISLAVSSARVSASGNDVVIYGEPDEAAISVDVPGAGSGERAVFDFILDPEGLLYDTGAARYGGGRVEEGATLLFRNRDGEYDYSGQSDFVHIGNGGTAPFTVTVSAQLTGLGGLQIAEDAGFQDSEACGIYLAIIDHQGREQPLSAEGAACLVWEIQPDSGFDSYSFGLTGACNPNACWQDYADSPVVTVTWHVEPVLAETEDGQQDGGGEVLEESAPGERDALEETEGPGMEAGAPPEEEPGAASSEMAEETLVGYHDSREQ